MMTTVCIWGEMSLTGHASVVIEDDYLSFHPKNPELLNDLEENIPDIVPTTNSAFLDFSLPEQPNDLEKVSAFFKSLSPKSQNLLRDMTVGTTSILRPWDWDNEKCGDLIEEIHIDGLDTGKMQSKLGQFRKEVDSGKRKYQLFTSNCSTLSAELLLVGSGVDNVHKTMEQFWNEISSVKRPPFLNQDIGKPLRLLERVREGVENVLVMSTQNRVELTPLSKVIAGLLIASDVVTREFFWTPGDVKLLADKLARGNH